jgi:hypothetical protein
MQYCPHCGCNQQSVLARLDWIIALFLALLGIAFIGYAFSKLGGQPAVDPGVLAPFEPTPAPRHFLKWNDEPQSPKFR